MSDDQLAFGWGDADRPAPAAALLPRASALAERLRALSLRGVYIGTSSWKYTGWLGQVYDPTRYTTRGRLSQKRFNESCLAEYARVFPTVCGDFAFYRFPTPAFWEQTFDPVPAGFRFSLKVPEDITVQRFPKLPRYGRRGGEDNPSFLDAGLLTDRLLAPLAPYRDRLGVLILQFGTFHRGPMADPTQFAERLDAFLRQIPTDRFQLAVEVRNRAFLHDAPDYLDCLRSHGVAHCLNSWTRMPPIGEQLALPGVRTAPHTAARFLLRPGRTYAQAVDRFAPYERVQDPYPEGRDALRRLIDGLGSGRQQIYIFVNNRLEGNAIETIEAAVGRPGTAPGNIAPP